MKTKKSKKIMLSVCFFLSFVFFAGCVINLREMEKCPVKYILYEENISQYTGAYAMEIQSDNAEQEESLNFTFWGNQGKEEVSGVELQRSQTCEIVAICGNSRNLYENAPALYTEDKSGCLLSESAALALFGDTNVVGVSVIFQEKTLVIRGVIPQKQPLLVYEISEQTAGGLNHVAINQESNNSLTKPDQKFMSRYGEGISYDFSQLCHILRWLSAIFIAFIIAGYEKEVIKNFHKKTGVTRALLILSGVGTLILSGILYIKIFEISFSNFPAVWSDFDSWKEFWSLRKETMLTLLTEKTEVFMYPYWQLFLKGIAWYLGLLCCTFLVRRNLSAIYARKE